MLPEHFVCYCTYNTCSNIDFYTKIKRSCYVYFDVFIKLYYPISLPDNTLTHITAFTVVIIIIWKHKRIEYLTSKIM